MSPETQKPSHPEKIIAPIRRLDESIVVRVVVTREFRLRLRLGLLALRFGCWLIGLAYRGTFTDGDGEPLIEMKDRAA